MRPYCISNQKCVLATLVQPYPCDVFIINSQYMCKLAAVSHKHEGTAIFQNISNYTSQHVLVPYKTLNFLQHCCGTLRSYIRRCVSQLELIHCFGISVIIAKINVINTCRHPLIEVLIYWQIAEGIITVHLNVTNPP